jgi:hypothetical protein
MGLSYLRRDFVGAGDRDPRYKTAELSADH